MHTTIRLATNADRGATAAMLARAFRDDPAFAYILPDAADRAKRLPRIFALLFDSDGRVGMRLLTEGGDAATLWRGPGQAQVGWAEMLRHAVPLLTALGGATRRAMTVSDAIDAHMPAGHFWYLHIAGCDPAAQGRGLGRAALQAGLARAAGRLPCYLETATERNLGFYAAAGFAVTGEWRVGRGGPRFWSMLRPAD
jgi:ribosomal protein S18 acetylase RimI-like enzyme